MGPVLLRESAPGDRDAFIHHLVSVVSLCLTCSLSAGPFVAPAVRALASGEGQGGHLGDRNVFIHHVVSVISLCLTCSLSAGPFVAPAVRALASGEGQGGHLGKTGYDICVSYTLPEAWDFSPGTLVNDEEQVLT